MSELQHDETVINSVFLQHLGRQKNGKPAAYVSVRPGATFQSLAWNVFHVEKAPGVKVDTVTKLKPEIDHALTHMQSRAIVCHIDPLSLRIMTPRRTPAKIDMVQRLQRIARDEYGKRTLGALVGEVVTSRGVGSQLIDLSRPETPHMLVAGQSGSGKSYEMINIVVSMAMLNNPRDLEIMVLDPKAVDWHIINGLPGLKYRVIEDLDACVAAFDDAMRELEYRKAQRMKNPQKRYVVVVDEMADLITTGGADVIRGIERIVQIGRGYGVHLIGGTQKPTNSVFGSDTIKANMPLRLVGRFSQKTDANTAAGVTGSGAETLINKGSFVKVDNGMDMVQAYHLDENRLVDWLRNNMVDVQEYAQKRGGIERRYQPKSEVVRSEDAIPQPNTSINTGKKLDFDVNRPPTVDEARVIRAWSKVASKNAVIREFFPTASKDKCLKFINAALTRQEVNA